MCRLCCKCHQVTKGNLQENFHFSVKQIPPVWYCTTSNSYLQRGRCVVRVDLFFRRTKTLGRDKHIINQWNKHLFDHLSSDQSLSHWVAEILQIYFWCPYNYLKNVLCIFKFYVSVCVCVCVLFFLKCSNN